MCVPKPISQTNQTRGSYSVQEAADLEVMPRDKTLRRNVKVPLIFKRLIGSLQGSLGSP